MSLQAKVLKARRLGVAVRGYRGDPGLFGSIGKALKSAAGIASNFIPGGGVLRAGLDLLGGPRQGLPVPTGGGGGTLPMIVQGAGRIAKALPIVGAAKALSSGAGAWVDSFTGGKPRRKYRRMNPLNPKALSRSIRRVSKFQDFARSVGFSRAPARFKGVHVKKRRRR